MSDAVSTDEIQKVLCSIPWKHMSSRPSGEYRLCCLAKQPDSTFRDESGKTMRLLTTPIEQSRNSAIAKDVRKTMLEGKWHSVCKKCHTEETAGLRSRRVFYQEKESDKQFLQNAIAKTAPDGSIRSEDFLLETFDIRIGNLCNLKCRMCGPIYSTKWFSDYKALTGSDFFYSGGDQVHFTSQDLERFNWHEQDYFWNELLKIGNQIQHIYMIGGEPLIIKKQVSFLKQLVELGFAQNIEIEYNSNLTVLPEDIIEIWKQFKKVTIGISIESIYEENDYIRHPSKFSNIVDNIKYLDTHVSPKLRIWLTTTFQIFNVFSLPKLIDWVDNGDFRFIKEFPQSPLIHIHPAHSPLYYNIQCLPPEAKQKAKQLLLVKRDQLQEKFEETGSKSYLITAKKLDSVMKFLMAKDDPASFQEFVNITRKLDGLRKESFSKTFPDLSSWIEFEKYSTIIDSSMQTNASI